MPMKKMGKILTQKPENYPGFWLSVSKIKVFKTCPAQYRYNYIERLPTKEKDYHIYGKFTHDILEGFHKRKIEGCDLSNEKLMNECFQSSIEQFKDKLQDKQKDEAFNTMMTYLTLLDSGDPNLSNEVTGVEEGFWIDINEEVLLRGFIDRTQIDKDGVLHVADYKTAKKKRYLEKDFLQLKTYAYVKSLEYPHLDKIRCSYIMLRHDFDYITKEFTREEISDVEGTLLEYAETIQSEKLFRPETSPLCAYCDFEEICPEGQIAAQEYRERKRKREERFNTNPRWGKESW